MKRDWNLLREQVLFLDAGESTSTVLVYTMTVRESAIQEEHMRLLVEAGWVDAERVILLGGHSIYYLNARLTMDGCDAAEFMRDEARWKEKMARMTAIGIPMIWEFIKD